MIYLDITFYNCFIFLFGSDIMNIEKEPRQSGSVDLRKQKNN